MEREKKSWEYMGEPIRKAGGYTFKELMAFLQIKPGSHYILTNHMRALGITLEPFKRSEKYVTKQYKNVRRPFTEDEARRVMERHYAIIGRELERE